MILRVQAMTGMATAIEIHSMDIWIIKQVAAIKEVAVVINLVAAMDVVVVDIITEALPDSTISENVFDCYEQDASSSQQDIESWLSELGY